MPFPITAYTFSWSQTGVLAVFPVPSTCGGGIAVSFSSSCCNCVSDSEAMRRCQIVCVS